MNANELRGLYTGVELHRPVAFSEVRDQSFARCGGHPVRLTRIGKLGMHGLGLCGDPGSRLYRPLRGEGRQEDASNSKLPFKHLLQGLPVPPIPRPRSTPRTSGNGPQARSATRLELGE